MPTETVFKLVSRRNRKLLSWQVGRYPGFDVTYQSGILAKPVLEGSLLFAFSDLQRAIHWRNGDPNSELWEAEAEDPQPVTKVAAEISEEGLRKFWLGFNEEISFLQALLHQAVCIPVSEGIVGCKSIKLVRRIEESELQKTA